MRWFIIFRIHGGFFFFCDGSVAAWLQIIINWNDFSTDVQGINFISFLLPACARNTFMFYCLYVPEFFLNSGTYGQPAHLMEFFPRAGCKGGDFHWQSDSSVGGFGLNWRPSRALLTKYFTLKYSSYYINPWDELPPRAYSHPLNL